MEFINVKELKVPFDVCQEMYGGNQMDYKNEKDINTGCGIVALTNIYVYNKGQKYSKEELLKIQEETTKYLKGPVLLPFQFLSGAKKLFASENKEILKKVKWAFTSESSSFKKLIDFVKESVNAGVPVALLIGPGVPFSENKYRSDFEKHWVLITEYFDDERNNGFDLNVSVSSWGQKFEISLKALLDSKLFISAVTVLPYRQGDFENNLA